MIANVTLTKRKGHVKDIDKSAVEDNIKIERENNLTNRTRKDTFKCKFKGQLRNGTGTTFSTSKSKKKNKACRTLYLQLGNRSLKEFRTTKTKLNETLKPTFRGHL